MDGWAGGQACITTETWHSHKPFSQWQENLQIDSLVQDCSNSSANALQLLQSCTKPSKWIIRLPQYLWSNLQQYKSVHPQRIVIINKNGNMCISYEIFYSCFKAYFVLDSFSGLVCRETCMLCEIFSDCFRAYFSVASCLALVCCETHAVWDILWLFQGLLSSGQFSWFDLPRDSHAGLSCWLLYANSPRGTSQP